jgi:uncharacterized protein
MNTLFEDVITAMSDPDIYPHRPSSVRVIHTHISVVFVSEDLVYKIKKPLNLGFLDFSDLDKRAYFCNQEVELNRRFSENIYLGVIWIYQGRSGINLDGDGIPVEVAVLMKRIPEDRILLNILGQDKVEPELIDRIADRIAEIHSMSPTNQTISSFGSVEVISQNLQENFTQTLPYIGLTIDSECHRSISRLASDFLDANMSVFEERVRNGFIRDCHGDLHVDHVIVMNGIMLCDCIEFNDRFRYCDTAADIGFLLMDLDYSGFPAFSKTAAERYAKTSGDTGILDLFPFYKSYRAFVRGKVSSFALDEPEIPTGERSTLKDTAQDYFRLALSYFTHDSSPILIITMGLTGAGKSFLASKLGVRLGIEILRSDVIRKEIHGVSPLHHQLDNYTVGLYTPEATESTYRSLLERARKCVESGNSVIIDASFLNRKHRILARDLAQALGARFSIIQCSAEDDVVRTRLDARLSDRNESSDGRWEIFLAQKSAFDPISASEADNCRRYDSVENLDSFLAKYVRRIISG